MATADELLSTIDTDKTLIIDKDLRTITIPSSVKNLGVESDDDVLRLKFSMPRMYGDVDLSDFSIYINYMNAKNTGDVYVVDDKTIADDTITFSWLVGRVALAYKGSVRFIVCMKKHDNDSNIIQEYNTTIASLPVLEGLETGETIVQQYPDIIEMLLSSSGTTDHSKLENRDAADQHPISAITGLEEALTPLVGTTQTITPSQVLAAIKAGRDIALQYTHSYYGTFVFSAFNANEQQGIVVSNSILPDADGLTGTLVGIVESGVWNFSATNTATKDDVGTAVNEALAQAKASGEFDGADGLTPTIGDNGNWYLGETDTGMPSRGEKGDKGDKGDTGETGATGAAGAAGKSAYAYAQDGGYTGTETEFAAKLAQEKFANPNALTFTGAVTGAYDGSAPVTVAIPSGGGAAVETWDLLINAEIAEDCTEVIFNSGDAGETLSDYKELLVLIDLFGNTGGFTTALKIGFLNAVRAWHSPYSLQMRGYSAETVEYHINMFRFKKTEYGILPVNRYTQYNNASMSNGLSHASGTATPVITTDFTLPISANQHVTTDMTDFTSQKEFERLVIGGYQAVIGAGTIIKVWGMK